MRSRRSSRRSPTGRFARRATSRAAAPSSPAPALGAAAWWVRRVVLPPRPDDAATARPHRVPDPERRPSPDGTGVTIAVNPSSGPAWSAIRPTSCAPACRRRRSVCSTSDDDITEVLGDREPGRRRRRRWRRHAERGGGGRPRARRRARRRAVGNVQPPRPRPRSRRRPDAIAAVRAGTAIHMDLGVVDIAAARADVRQHADVRRLHAGRRRPRATAAAARQVAGAARVARAGAAADGAAAARARWRTRPRCGWGGSATAAYAPDGFGPSWRERLDDGRLDVRLVLGGPPVARARFVVDVLIGRLQRCPVYRERLVESLEVRSLSGPLRLAVDGETVDGGTTFDVTKRPRALLVAVPPVASDVVRPRPTRSSASPAASSAC